MRVKELRWAFVGIMFVLLVRICSASSVEEVVQAGDERESYLGGYTFIWELTETRIYPPQDPQAVGQEYRGLEKYLLSQGVRDVQRVRQQLSELASRDIAGRRETTRSEWVIVRGRQVVQATRRIRKDGERVRGAGGIVLQGVEECRWYLSRSLGMRVNTRTPHSALGDVMPEHITVWCCEGDCYRYTVPDLSIGISSEELALVAGLNLLRTRGANQWEITEESARRLRLSNREVLDEGNLVGIGIEAVLQTDRAFCPYQVRVQANDVRIECRVLSLRSVGRYWLPERIEVEEWFPRIVRFHRVWRLKEVSRNSREVSLEDLLGELSRIPTVRGAGVLDYRLAGCRLTTARYFEAREREEYVSYKWTGKLPSIEVLRRMQARQSSQPSIRSFSGWRFVPPILLILIGALWYWWLRRKARA